MHTPTSTLSKLAIAVASLSISMLSSHANAQTAPTNSGPNNRGAVPASTPSTATPRAVTPIAPVREHSGRVLRQDEAPPPQATQSLTAQMLAAQPAFAADGTRADYGCLFAVSDVEPKLFAIHDLITIVISESSRGKSKQNAKADKTFALDGGIQNWLTSDIINPADLPAFSLDIEKDFQGKGDYQRTDDFTARVTAEIVEIKPNGLLVLEAHRTIVQDEEEQTIMLTGLCRPEDVDANNQVPSHRVADATIKKMNKGMLRDVSEKGIVAKVLDALFAF
ncbi:MAG: flagellar basal body L-ring protein FlgH [Phycisphaerales bacterium]|nr:flagellar basal body L-ring protein FlgH [Phycisphaerales bacterium]